MWLPPDLMSPGHDGSTLLCRYRLAEKAGNPQAMWNLGYLHEMGLGLPQDLNLAKR